MSRHLQADMRPAAGPDPDLAAAEEGKAGQLLNGTHQNGLHHLVMNGDKPSPASSNAQGGPASSSSRSLGEPPEGQEGAPEPPPPKEGALRRLLSSLRLSGSARGGGESKEERPTLEDTHRRHHWRQPRESGDPDAPVWGLYCGGRTGFVSGWFVCVR